MTYYEVSEFLKKHANPNGNFVTVNLINAYETIQSLGLFFRYKKHEWLAICFLAADFKCKKIYFEKGEDNSGISVKLKINKAVQYAINNQMKYIIVAHNHPLSSIGIASDGQSMVKYRTDFHGRKELLNFSQSDKEYLKDWLAHCERVNIGMAFSVAVSGKMFFEGDLNVLNNISKNDPLQSRIESLKYYDQQGGEHIVY